MKRIAKIGPLDVFCVVLAFCAWFYLMGKYVPELGIGACSFTATGCLTLDNFNRP